MRSDPVMSVQWNGWKTVPMIGNGRFWYVARLPQGPLPTSGDGQYA